MAEYSMNKGIDADTEFKGLKAQYLFIFAGGLLAIFILVIILYMSGASQWFTLLFGLISSTLLVWGTFYLNRRYGTHGIMKAFAKRQHPKRVRHDKPFKKLI